VRPTTPQKLSTSESSIHGIAGPQPLDQALNVHNEQVGRVDRRVRPALAGLQAAVKAENVRDGAIDDEHCARNGIDRCVSIDAGADTMRTRVSESGKRPPSGTAQDVELIGRGVCCSDEFRE
jgi:hypothetical protein